MLAVALLSFDARDPGFSFTGEGATIHNRVGPVGAWFADALYFLFGRPAYLLPVMLGVAAWRLARGGGDAGPTHSRLNLAVRVAGFLVMLVASCALAALHWTPGTLPQGAGGIVGSAAGEALVRRAETARCDAAAAGRMDGRRCGRLSACPGSR